MVSKPYRYARKVTVLNSKVRARKWFQNLIGMLGSSNIRIKKQPHKNVSKPYRYARKVYYDHLDVDNTIVSKPYRYARKVGIETWREEFYTEFQNLIGMLGSFIYLEYA